MHLLLTPLCPLPNADHLGPPSARAGEQVWLGPVWASLIFSFMDLDGCNNAAVPPGRRGPRRPTYAVDGTSAARRDAADPDAELTHLTGPGQSVNAPNSPPSQRIRLILA